MKRFLILSGCALLLTGCAANLGFQFGNSGKSATAPSVGPGGSFSSGGVAARFGDSPGWGSILGIGALGALLGRDQRGLEPRTPELDSNRRVNEQDCRKPVESGGNLRCN
jgi:hypothetical protein